MPLNGFCEKRLIVQSDKQRNGKKFRTLKRGEGQVGKKSWFSKQTGKRKVAPQ